MRRALVRTRALATCNPVSISFDWHRVELTGAAPTPQVLFGRLSKGEKEVPAAGAEPVPGAAAGKPELEDLRTQQAELNRLLATIASMSASLDPRPAGGRAEDRPRPAGLRAHDCGASFEGGAKGWLDVFCRELLLVWFRQHEVLEAQLIRAFDEFDLVRATGHPEPPALDRRLATLRQEHGPPALQPALQLALQENVGRRMAFAGLFEGPAALLSMLSYLDERCGLARRLSFRRRTGCLLATDPANLIRLQAQTGQAH